MARELGHAALASKRSVICSASAARARRRVTSSPLQVIASFTIATKAARDAPSARVRRTDFLSVDCVGPGVCRRDSTIPTTSPQKDKGTHDTWTFGGLGTGGSAQPDQVAGRKVVGVGRLHRRRWEIVPVNVVAGGRSVRSAPSRGSLVISILACRAQAVDEVLLRWRGPRWPAKHWWRIYAACLGERLRLALQTAGMLEV